MIEWRFVMKNVCVFALVGLVLCGCERNDWRSTDQVKILDERKSPDGKHTATVFYCSGGGAAGYTYTNVNVRRSSEPLNQRDFLLGQHLWHSFADISLSWEDATTLRVAYGWASESHEYREQNSQTKRRVGEVKVNYLVKDYGLSESSGTAPARGAVP